MTRNQGYVHTVLGKTGNENQWGDNEDSSQIYSRLRKKGSEYTAYFS
jgi:hypothetical protein